MDREIGSLIPYSRHPRWESDPQICGIYHFSTGKFEFEQGFRFVKCKISINQLFKKNDYASTPDTRSQIVSQYNNYLRSRRSGFDRSVLHWRDELEERAELLPEHLRRSRYWYW